MDTPGTPIAAESPSSSPTSLGSRLVNIFATPGEVFEEIKTAKPQARNWLVPVLLACGAAAVYMWILYSQPAMQQKIQDAQEKQLQRMVAAGKIAQKDLESAREKGSQIGLMVVKIASVIGVVPMSFAMLFVVALVIWLIGSKLWKGQFAFMKAVEVAGLAGMIGVLDAVVSALLVAATGSIIAKPGPALLIHDLDQTKLPQMLLASFSLVQLWYVGVLAVGLAKLSGVSLGKAAAWLYAIWCCLMFGMVTIGWLVGRATGSM